MKKNNCLSQSLIEDGQSRIIGLIMRKWKPQNMVSQINLSIEHEDVIDEEEIKKEDKLIKEQALVKMSEESFFNDTVEEMDFNSFNKIKDSI